MLRAENKGNKDKDNLPEGLEMQSFESKEWEVRLFDEIQLIENHFNIEDKKTLIPDNDHKSDARSLKTSNQASSSIERASNLFNHGVKYLKGRGVPRDVEKGIRLIFEAAFQQYAPAQCYLGSMYNEGHFVPHDNEEAVRLYRLASKQGYILAQSRLGWMIEHGRGTSQNYKEAAHFYQLAADQGDALSQYRLASMHAQRFSYRGVPYDCKEAIRLYTEAAKTYAPAQYQLGLIYKEGRLILKDIEQANFFLNKATEQGYKPEYTAEQWDHYLAFKESRIIPRSLEESKHLYQLLADQKDARGQFLLGLRYEEEHDYKKAIELFRNAADQKYPPAKHKLASQPTTSHQESEELYLSCAAEGYPESQCALGLLYIGSPIPKIRKEGCDLLRRAADQGHADALYQLASLYQHGHPNLPRDLKKSVCLLKRAAEKHHPKAYSAIARIYLKHKTVVKPDPKELIRILLLAADQGYGPAQHALAIRYETGHGVPLNKYEATHFMNLVRDISPTDPKRNFQYSSILEKNPSPDFKFLTTEAKEGDLNTLLTLGLILKDGRHYCTSLEHYHPDRAAYYFFEAARRGDSDARYHLQQICLLKHRDLLFNCPEIMLFGALILGFEYPVILQQFNDWAKKNPKDLFFVLEKYPSVCWDDVRLRMTHRAAHSMLQHIKQIQQLIPLVIAPIVTTYLFGDNFGNGISKKGPGDFGIFASQQKSNKYKDNVENPHSRPPSPLG